jgi:hypothetical protein
MTINVPIIQEHNSGRGNLDTLEIQINGLDTHGYPLQSSVLLDTMIIDSNSIGMGNDSAIKMITWNVSNFSIAGSEFAVSVFYRDTSKLDSCWFVYGYNSFHRQCPAEPNTDTLFALPTDFSRITSSPNTIANSFEVWNEYVGISSPGFFPSEGGNNIFFPCNPTDYTFHPDTDGANYFQDIHIFIYDTLNVYSGIASLHTPGISVSQNYPNPFTSTSVINYSIVNSSDVTFTVNDITGREVFSRNYGIMNPGSHSITMNAAMLAPGIYFYTINASGTAVTKKMAVY